jgi:hypothetical protein
MTQPQPKGNRRLLVAVRIAQKGLDQVDGLAERVSVKEGRKVTRSEMLRRLVQTGLQHYPDPGRAR